MKKVSILCVGAVMLGLASCATAPKADLATEVDSLSYAIGAAQSNGLTMYLQQQGIEAEYMGDFLKGFIEAAGRKAPSTPAESARLMGENIGQQIASNISNIDRQLAGKDSVSVLSKKNLIAGFLAGVRNDTTHFKSVNAATEYANTHMQSMQAKLQESAHAAWKAENEKFLETNKSKDSVQVTPSGLQYKIIKEGTGEKPTATSRVQVKYEGKLIDGTVFDSSYTRPEPVTTFGVNQVISGWGEAIQMMPVGSTWELYIPQGLGYGTRDQGTIKPYSTLIFKVELVGIEAPEK
ncbi:MAG: FKBP-type peptidyl-prolyl cis-trans isomerase [Prevotellaceae bacterium]|jgi:FKBP-type peptidyl-prolyl cis-trans isomerase FklB|nr:FKBP-type peptidyl-prolyl cis-trans isomerase [Prevotellaceae bacterium]